MCHLHIDNDLLMHSEVLENNEDNYHHQLIDAYTKSADEV